jgi:hypothetical protein
MLDNQSSCNSGTRIRLSHGPNAPSNIAAADTGAQDRAARLPAGYDGMPDHERVVVDALNEHFPGSTWSDNE